ncbi:MAG: hypothetical protein ABSH41_23395 [Syntrophobacteraceae bacterium]
MNELTAVVVLLAIVGGFLGWFWLAPGGVLSLRRIADGDLQVDVRLAYSPSTLYRLLGKYGKKGRRSFQRMLLVDMVFPAVYGTSLYLLSDLLAALHETQLKAWSIAQIFAISAAAFDYTENALLLSIVRRFPARHVQLARAASICTSLKMLSFFVAVFALIAQ